jgi:methylmalonyl-CoA mutase N-terminal domain/subunit
MANQDHSWDEIGAITAAAAEWRQQQYDPAIRALPERRPFTTDVGLEVAALYTPADLDAVGFDYLRDVGFPGQFPFTRGDRPTMYRNEPFVISAYSGFGDASECNKRFKKLLDWGAEQILVALDLPTQCGYDSDDVMSVAEVGQVGVAIDTLTDLEMLFDGIAIDKVKRIGTLGNSIGPIVLAMFAALGERRGLDPSQYTVNLQNDPLKEYIARGTQILPVHPAAHIATDCVSWCADHAPGWSPITVCVNHINAGGAGSSRATAVALSNAIHYIETLLAKGHTIDEVAPLFHMFPDERHEFFVQIANLRALRRVWARIMKERFGATRPESMALRTTVYGHGQETLQEPINNVARIGFGTLAYVLGGASYVYIAAYDEAVSTPNEGSMRVGLRTEEIIAHEHGFTDTIDPLAGSYFVENLTSRVEAQILAALAEIDAAGGAMGVIEQGLGRRWMTEGAVRRQRAIDSGGRPWVTVNKWPEPPDVPNTAFRIDSETTRRQIDRLRQIKDGRDAKRVAETLAAIDDACRTGANQVGPALEAVKIGVTVGEICARWRAHFGVFEPSTEF